MTTPISIVGISGFSGAELARLIGADDDLRLVAGFSDRARGEPVAGLGPNMGRSGAVIVRPQAEAEHAADEAAIVALATPAEVSAELAPKLLARGARVIDLSGAFRLPDVDMFLEYYRFAHPEPALLKEAHYGLPQVPRSSGDAPAIGLARLVANPGCYATAAILALAPLLVTGLIDAHGIFIDGKSGVTGAGRTLAEAYLFNEVSENISSYRVAEHQHTPEIELALSRTAGREVLVTFAPHLMPIRRGLMATCYGSSAADPTQELVTKALFDFYAAIQAQAGIEPVVEVRPIEQVSVQPVVNSPRALVGAKLDRRNRSIVTSCTIDNLLKGAASQALENIRRMIAPR